MGERERDREVLESACVCVCKSDERNGKESKIIED